MPVAFGLEQIAHDARQEAQPGDVPFAGDDETVSDEEPHSFRMPADSCLRRYVVDDGERTGMEDRPAERDGAQGKIIFFPGEEQIRVIAAGLRPGGAADGMAGTDEGGCGKVFMGGVFQALRIAPAEFIEMNAVAREDPEGDRAEFGGLPEQRVSGWKYSVAVTPRLSPPWSRPGGYASG